MCVCVCVRVCVSPIWPLKHVREGPDVFAWNVVVVRGVTGVNRARPRSASPPGLRATVAADRARSPGDQRDTEPQISRDTEIAARSSVNTAETAEPLATESAHRFDWRSRVSNACSVKPHTSLTLRLNPANVVRRAVWTPGAASMTSG